MLCAALTAVQTHYRLGSGIASSKARQERLKLLNRLNVLGHLRVVSRLAILRLEQTPWRIARHSLRQPAARDAFRARKTHPDRLIQLLSNQVRYGGIGIYSTFLEECHLASMQSFACDRWVKLWPRSFLNPRRRLLSMTRIPGYRWTLCGNGEAAAHIGSLHE